METTPSQLTTAHSIHSWLPSTPGDRLLHVHPKDKPCHSDRDQLTTKPNLA